ncbi:uncharacterized protein LOC122023066 [Zingiber officinale]|uniref:uncharacterized protein LOC122023066 n=1 Tax=Zingiber officinale TaxID=94328 RepID=UPI001C4ABDD5|nr:uncharacterized protein LOC122023066 [Zingiber officinale]
MVKVNARKAQRTQDGRIHVIQEEPLLIAEELIPWEEVQLYPERPESLTRISSDLPIEVKMDLVQCLTRNRDIFAWSPKELLGVKPEVTEHRLHLLPNSRSVKQKKRNFSVEKNKIIRAEVDQLRKEGHIREVQFSSWLSNMVMVAKPNNKRRVYIDFRDLNRANPKDCYPLPRINQMVDSTSGNTYQRMMNKIFGEQIGWNVEVYVDDILIKSTLALSVRLNFRVTNNEAEYEALLAGLQTVRHVGAARVVVYSDSQLVAQQVTGNFEVNSDKLQLYWEVYEKMKEDFKEVMMTKILRVDN